MVIDRLASYEDTGLMPEEIEDFMKLAERMNVCELVHENLVKANELRHEEAKISMLQSELERVRAEKDALKAANDGLCYSHDSVCKRLTNALTERDKLRDLARFLEVELNG